MEDMRCDKKEIVIWGTGKYGNIAYYYFKDQYSILYYIDNDRKKWGNQFHGVEVHSPEIIYKLNTKIDIVLAIKYADDVKKQLMQIAPKNKISIFEASYSTYTLKEKINPLDENTIIIYFCGGLGNQMFQYVLLRKLQCVGKNAVADLSFYTSLNRTSEFILSDVFPNIKLQNCSEKQKNDLIERNKNIYNRKKFLIYKEPDIYEENRKSAETFLLDITGGYIQGYHQNYCFAESICDVLLNDFTFQLTHDAGLNKMCREIQNRNAVSIHIRRGDYLKKKNVDIYGGICTDSYYDHAMQYIMKKYSDITWCFFSNDIEWVKKKYQDKNAIFIDKEMFEDYHDWYDMYLMSKCKHNIIANSTFSWWAAWLNSNPEKTVIAPSIWINNCVYEDIYPENWIRL